jgi:cobyrinic acid a,c-diamide synthase
MGLFDGYDGRSEAGSTAQMAKWLGLPVLLVVDARSMARSAAALVQGFEAFDPELKFAGVLFNGIGSPRHLQYLREALGGHVNMAFLGGIPRQKSVAIPERHLGLVTHFDHNLSDNAVARLADLVEGGLDVSRFISGLPAIELVDAEVTEEGNQPLPAVHIAVARDNAFCFYYQDNLDLLAACGAQPVYFSPLTDSCLPAAIDGLYLGGGYPELFAARLAENRSMLAEVRRRSAEGMPIYGECGGMMYLGSGITDPDGRRHAMTGCLPIETRMLPRLRSLGYREVRLTCSSLLGEADARLRGHEFHYSEITSGAEGLDKIYRVSGRDGAEEVREGYCKSNTLASYIHLHFGSRPSSAAAFVRNCRNYRRERKRTA